MDAPIFAPRCGLPDLPSVRARRLVADCRVPAAPPPVVACRDSVPDLNAAGALFGRRKITAQILAVDPTLPRRPHAWTRLREGVAGTWVTVPGEHGGVDPATGHVSASFDPAYALDGSSAPPGSIVEMTRGFLNDDWRFSPGGGGGCADTPADRRVTVYVPTATRSGTTLKIPKAQLGLVGCVPTLFPSGTDSVGICCSPPPCTAPTIIRVRASGCGGPCELVGSAVAVTGPAGFSGSCTISLQTTGPDDCYCDVTVPDTLGTYTVVVTPSDPRYGPGTATVDVATCQVNDVAVGCPVLTTSATFCVRPCGTASGPDDGGGDSFSNFGLEGASVTITKVGGGDPDVSFSGSCTTAFSGYDCHQACCTITGIPTGIYSIEVSASEYITYTGTIEIDATCSPAGPFNFILASIPGYICCPDGFDCTICHEAPDATLTVALGSNASCFGPFAGQSITCNLVSVNAAGASYRSAPCPSSGGGQVWPVVSVTLQCEPSERMLGGVAFQLWGFPGAGCSGGSILSGVAMSQDSGSACPPAAFHATDGGGGGAGICDCTVS